MNDDSPHVGSDNGTPAEDDRPERRYDSFHLRVWVRRDDAHLLRVEVRHLQTGLTEVAVAPSPSWLLETVLAFLAEGPLPEDGTPRS